LAAEAERRRREDRPALLIDLNVNTNVGFMIFGVALLFALRSRHSARHDQDRRAHGAVRRHQGA
jgi:hypothetical protein